MNPKRKFQLVLFVFFPAIILLLAARVVHQGQPPELLPTTTPTKNPYGDFKVNIPDKALLKNYVVVSLETTPGTICQLTYVPPNGEIHITTVTADADGICEWRWKLEEAEGKGHGRLIFTIDGVSDTHFIEIRASF
jgi:hypothetical protein